MTLHWTDQQRKQLGEIHRKRFDVTTEAGRAARRRLSEGIKRYFESHPNPRKGVPNSAEALAKMKATREKHKGTPGYIERMKKQGARVKGWWTPERRKERSQQMKEQHRSGEISQRMEKNPLWKGGRSLDKKGYVLLRRWDHPNAERSGYVREHRLVMSHHLGRPLRKDEIIHHINGIKTDNRIENLSIVIKGHGPHGEITCPFCNQIFCVM